MLRGKGVQYLYTFWMFILLLSLGYPFAHSYQLRDEGITAISPISEYSGSDACRECHKQQYKHWSQTLMSSFVNYRWNLENLPGTWKQSPFEKENVFWVVGKNEKMHLLILIGRSSPMNIVIKKRNGIKRIIGTKPLKLCLPCS